ncbi:MAG: PAS domain S-box protein, partial [Campylobacterota bacterium]|nr:PAS domain S-box protein [Campylobacterota bacterium]
MIFKILVSKQELEIEVYNKTKELKELNNNLENIVEEQTVELHSNIDIISKHVIYSRTNTKGTILEVSDAFCNISGYLKDELIGESHNIVKSSDTPSEVFNDMWTTINSGKEWKGEIKNKKKDGGYYWVYASILPEFDDQNNIKSYMAIRDDITSKKDFEMQHLQLLEAEKMASLGEMIGNIAHQWRQPLSFISTIASGVQMKQSVGILDIDSLPNDMEQIVERTTYLSNVINTFRNFLMEKKEK